MRARQKPVEETGGEPTTLEALKEANQQLRLASDQLHAILDQGLFMARLELDGTLVHVNRSALEVPGYKHEQVFKRLFWDCGWWNRAPEVQEWIKDAVRQAASGVVFRGDSRYFWADGSEHIVDFACLPIRDVSGKVVLLVATGMDITERVQSEQHRRALEEERQRAEALSELDRAKTAFFSNVSHEFRTPLTLMLGPLEELMARYAQQNPANARQDLENLGMVHRNGLRLLKLVNTLLDFSRIEAGRIDASFEPVDLAAFTTELASVFRSAIEKAGLRLVVDCPPLPEPVYVDRQMWEKIVLNLLSNAFKFTFEGEIRVALCWQGQTVELAVADTGIGIPPDQQTRVFDRFHRVANARARTHEGTGIGLALVQELSRLHGGETRVQSVVDRGSVFTVSLRTGFAHLPKDKMASERKLASTSTSASSYVEESLRWLPDSRPNGAETIGLASEQDIEGASRIFQSGQKTARILLADDNADMREYVRRLLIQRGYEVTAVPDGEAALAAAREHLPGLVISDIMMPRLDGVGLLKTFRGDPRLRSIPVILLSARAGEEARVEGLKHGADDYLIKPFSHRELLARVESHLELSRLRRAAEESERRERERLEFLTDAAQIGVWFCDLPFDKLEWDHRVKEHFWLPPHAEVTIGLFFETIHPDDRERTRLAIEESIARKSRYDIDYRTLAPDGRTKWIRAIGHSHFDASGNPIRFDGITIDITSRVHAEMRNRFLVSLDDALRPLIDPREITLTAARVLGQHLQADRCAYADVEADADTMNLTGDYARSPEIKSIVGRLKFSDFGQEVLRLMRENLPFVVDDVDHHQPPVGDPQAYRAAQIQSVICVPLRKAGRLVAAMAVHMARPRRWNPEEVELVSAVAARCWESIERARLERSLQQSEDHFRAFVTTSSDVVYRMSANWSEMRLLKGKDFLPDTDAPERDWIQKYLFPKDRPTVLAAIQKAIAAKSVFELEHPVIRVDGTAGWTLSRAIPLLNSQGEITEWFGAATDVTERRLAEEKLREQTRVLELLKDTGTAIAAELDLQNLVQIITDAATKLCGAQFGAFFYNTTNDQGESYLLYTLSGTPREAFEKLGMPRNTPVFHPTFAGQGVVRSDDITADPRYGKMAPHHGMPKGHLPVRSYLAVPVISRGGGVIGGLFFGHPETAMFTEQIEELVSGIAAQASIAIDNATLYQAAQREIAERKKVADELQQAREKLSHHAEELEKQVALRTASLKEALAQLEEFSYSVSHDLRAPLRAIEGYNKVIRDDYSALLPEEAVAYLDRIERGAQRMNRLVNDLLAMSRVARAEIKLHPIPLQRFIEEIVEHRPDMQTSVADIRVSAPHSVIADDVPLSQALTNLLSNAVKFIEPGERARIVVRSEKAGDRVRVWVEDSGLGIPERHRDKLFGMFQRLPVKSQVEGTGIGLAIVRKAVERMGGKVGMESNEPKGSRFWIELEGAAA